MWVAKSVCVHLALKQWMHVQYVEYGCSVDWSKEYSERSIITCIYVYRSQFEFAAMYVCTYILCLPVSIG